MIRKLKIPGTRVLWLMGLLIVAGLAISPARAQDGGGPTVVVLEASGPVVPAFGSYLTRGLDEADRLNAEAVVIVLDTPGGSVNVTLDIIQAIRTSDVPVIVYVGPPGAEAASAGLFIVLAGHAAAMAPDTAVGASSPVGPQGEDLPSTSQQKAEEYLSAQARSLAERRGAAAVEIASDAVNEARAVSASEARAANLVDFIADDVDDLLQQADGFEVEVNGRAQTLNTDDAQVRSLPMNMLERFLILITHPNIIALLFALGPIFILIEIRTPGGWVLGTIGVIALALALYGLGILPVNWLGAVFVALALAMFVLEIKAPTHGVLTAVGVASMAAGLIILFSDPDIEPFGRLSIPLVIAQSVALGAIFFFMAMMAVRAMHRQPTTGTEGLIGQIGRVTADLGPRGVVLVQGERWKAEAIGGQTVPVDAEVEVVGVSGLRLRVRAVRPEGR